MHEDSTPDSGALRYADLWEFLQDAATRTRRRGERSLDAPPQYRFALGRETLEMGVVEFRIMLLLASRPYHAFTRKAIVDGVGGDCGLRCEDDVDPFIATLREQLGCFHDYVQTVPYIGYRFKP
ncbi:MAG: helix-turn-helix domain-containing protein [Planctomycetota bacterium]